MTNPMYLIIDASARKTLVAYGDNAKIMAVREWVAGIKLSKELLPASEKILARRAKPRAIFCVTGPGSFTGMRIAVSTANALGYAWRLPVVPVEAFEIYEAAQKNLKAPYEVVLDNIRDLVYLKRVWRGKREYAVEKIERKTCLPAGRTKNVKRKINKITGWVEKEKQALISEQSHWAKAISGKVRAKLIVRIGTERLTAYKKFSRPITPLYINPPRITFKNNF